MKLTCVSKNLKEAVVVAERSTSKNQTLPILNSLLLEAKNNELLIRATNLETAIEIKISCKVESPGTIVVAGKTLSTFLSQLPDDTIQLQNQKDNLFIKTKKTQTTLRGYSHDEFPLFPSIESNTSFSVSSLDLKQGLENVIIAASNSTIKPELASVCCKVFKNTLKIAATDSFRLAEYTITSQSLNLEKSTTILIPHTSIQELIRLLDNNGSSSFGEEKEVMVTTNKNQIVFENKKIKFISRLIEGNFPDYDQIVPKSFKTEVIVKQKDLLHQIKLASVFVGRLQDISISFQPEHKNLLFKVSNSDIGEHSSELEVSIQGEESSAKFNWRYLFDGVSHIYTEYVTLGFNGEQSPLLIKTKGDIKYYYLAMPMRGI